MNSYNILSSAFLGLQLMNFIFPLIYMILNTLSIEPHFYNPEETKWSCCITFLICCWFQFAKALLRIFASIFISELSLLLLFLLVYSLLYYIVVFDNHHNVIFLEGIGEFTYIIDFWNSLLINSINYSLKVW